MRVVVNNIDKLRILQDGYFICYYMEDSRVMYSIKAKLKNTETFNYLAILWGPVSSDYVDDFIMQLLNSEKYEDFLNSKDPFMYIWDTHLLYKVKNNNLFNADNEYTLINQRRNNYLFCFC